LQGGDNAITRSDFGLLYCTALAHAHERSGGGRQAETWRGRCRDQLSALQGQGWETLWTDYAAARLHMLRGRAGGARQAAEKRICP
jgi:hypothetical protein